MGDFTKWQTIIGRKTTVFNLGTKRMKEQKVNMYNGNFKSFFI
jgi:hypothetical protein